VFLIEFLLHKSFSFVQNRHFFGITDFGGSRIRVLMKYLIPPSEGPSIRFFCFSFGKTVMIFLGLVVSLLRCLEFLVLPMLLSSCSVIHEFLIF